MNRLREHGPIWTLVAVTTADRALTLPNYQLEANPLVTYLGPSLWIVLTAVCLAGAVFAWYDCDLAESRTANVAVLVATVWTGLIVSVNLFVLLS